MATWAPAATSRQSPRAASGVGMRSRQWMASRCVTERAGENARRAADMHDNVVVGMTVGTAPERDDLGAVGPPMVWLHTGGDAAVSAIPQDDSSSARALAGHSRETSGRPRAGLTARAAAVRNVPASGGSRNATTAVPALSAKARAVFDQWRAAHTPHEAAAGHNLQSWKWPSTSRRSGETRRC